MDSLDYLTKTDHLRVVGTLLGCVAIAMIPFSFIFYYKGEKIRQMSRFVPAE